MSLLIFSALITSICSFIILASWYNIQGAFLQHLVMLSSLAIMVFFATILIAIQPILLAKKLPPRRDPKHEAVWGSELSNSLSSPAVVLDGFGVKFANTPFLQTMGMVGMVDQVLDMPFTNLVHPADHSRFTALSVDAMSGHPKNAASKLRLVCADGTTLASNCSLTRLREDGQHPLMLFQFTPTTSVQPLSNHYASQFNYHSIVDKLEDIIFQLNAEGNLLFLNPAWEHLLELKIQDCLGLALTAFVHPEDKPMLEAKLDALRQGKRASCMLEIRLLTLHGNPHWVALRAKSTISSAERTSVTGMMTDIQQHKETETSLLANKRAAHALLAHIPAMVYRSRNDRAWTFEFVNEACIDVTGYDAAELINNSSISFNRIIHPNDRQAVWDSVHQQISHGEEFKLIYRIVTRSGETKLVQEHGHGIFSSTGELLALEGFITEIPDQRYNVPTLFS